MKVDLPFLMAADIPINAENMRIFEHQNYSNVFEEFKRLRNRVQAAEELPLRKAS
jgi:uncharacterized protein YueI